MKIEDTSPEFFSLTMVKADRETDDHIDIGSEGPIAPTSYHHSFCCCGNLPNEACGWPQKTVRAILAIMVVLLGLGAEVTVALWLLHQNETSLAISITGLIATEVAGVSAFYFGISKRQSQNETEAVVIQESDRRYSDAVQDV